MNNVLTPVLPSFNEKQNLSYSMGKYVAILEEQVEEATTSEALDVLRNVIVAYKEFALKTVPNDLIVFDVLDLEMLVVTKQFHLGGKKKND